MLFGYYAVFMVYLFSFTRMENELAHYLTLVLLPLGLLYFMRKKLGYNCSYKQVLRSIGLSRKNSQRGLGLAFILGILLILIDLAWEAFALSKSPLAQISHLAQTGKMVYILPASFLVMLLTAGFTEEVFFRGILQTHLAASLRSEWLAIALTSILFGFYHVPYLLMWGFSESGVIVSVVERILFPTLTGLLLGYAYSRYRNLMVPIIIHAMANMPLLILSAR